MDGNGFHYSDCIILSLWCALLCWHYRSHYGAIYLVVSIHYACSCFVYFGMSILWLRPSNSFDRYDSHDRYQSHTMITRIDFHSIYIACSYSIYALNDTICFNEISFCCTVVVLPARKITSNDYFMVIIIVRLQQRTILIKLTERVTSVVYIYICMNIWTN